MTTDPTLSPAGRGRRDHIGRLAVRAAVARRRRRRLGRVAAVVAVVTAAVVAVRPHRPPGRVAEVPPPPVVAPPPPAGVVVTFVATDPGIVDRLRVPAAPPRWQVIGDRELLDALAAAGRPSGLIRTGGRVLVVTP